jgi:dipeptidyl aminopeptidase/acylaminoacyl peptidase
MAPESETASTEHKLWKPVAAILLLIVLPIADGLAQQTTTSAPSSQAGKMKQGNYPMSKATSVPKGLPDLIPREILFGNPQRTFPKLSPDGKYLAYLAPDDKNVLQVYLRTVGQADDRKLTSDKKRGVRFFFWTYDGRHLVYMQDSDGDENWHLFGVDVVSNLIRDLTPFPGVQAHGLSPSPDVPGEILVGLNVRDARLHDIYRVNLRNGAVEMEAQNPGDVIAWTADTGLKVRAALAPAKDDGFDLRIRRTAESDWETVLHCPPDEEVGPEGFTADGRTLYLGTNHDANTKRLVAMDTQTLKETTIAEDEQYDASDVLVHPISRVVQAVAFTRERVAWRVLDPSLEADFKALAAVRPGELGFLSRDLADRTWLVSYVADDGPVYFYSYDRASKSATLLFSNRPKLEGLPLAKMQPISFTARDGLEIHGYLTLPVGVEPKNLPAVLLVHGGPWARDTWGFDPWSQWLANRGYAVLQVNYRGSEGYGKKFLNAGNREWGGKMHADLIDAVEWAKARGIADPSRIAIMGGSYGGYATLVGMAFTPKVFACGVDLVGPSNLVTFQKTIPPYWELLRNLFRHRVGDPETEQSFLESRSPFMRADHIERPLLIAQGANDPRVKQSESDQIVQTMRRRGQEVRYLVYQDEGHGFARPENRLHFFAVVEEFLARHLGGRAEPMGQIQGHSAEEH